jgi:hypothetical protein
MGRKKIEKKIIIKNKNSYDNLSVSNRHHDRKTELELKLRNLNAHSSGHFSF